MRRRDRRLCRLCTPGETPFSGSLESHKADAGQQEFRSVEVPQTRVDDLGDLAEEEVGMLGRKVLGDPDAHLAQRLPGAREQFPGSSLWVIGSADRGELKGGAQGLAMQKDAVLADFAPRDLLKQGRRIGKFSAQQLHLG